MHSIIHFVWFLLAFSLFHSLLLLLYDTLQRQFIFYSISIRFATWTSGLLSYIASYGDGYCIVVFGLIQFALKRHLPNRTPSWFNAPLAADFLFLAVRGCAACNARVRKLGVAISAQWYHEGLWAIFHNWLFIVFCFVKDFLMGSDDIKVIKVTCSSQKSNSGHFLISLLLLDFLV